jgi:hypothetical protein
MNGIIHQNKSPLSLFSNQPANFLVAIPFFQINNIASHDRYPNPSDQAVKPSFASKTAAAECF